MLPEGTRYIRLFFPAVIWLLPPYPLTLAVADLPLTALHNYGPNYNASCCSRLLSETRPSCCGGVEAR